MRYLLLSLLALFVVALPAQASSSLTDRLSGYILLQVEQRGEAWYVNPDDQQRYYLKNGNVAYAMMRNFGLGISNENLQRATEGDQDVLRHIRGRIVLQVEGRGEAYYVHPETLKLTYMKDGEAAYSIMRNQSLGIRDNDLSLINAGDIKSVAVVTKNPSSETSQLLQSTDSVSESTNTTSEEIGQGTESIRQDDPILEDAVITDTTVETHAAEIGATEIAEELPSEGSNLDQSVAEVETTTSTIEVVTNDIETYIKDGEDFLRMATSTYLIYKVVTVDTLIRPNVNNIILHSLSSMGKDSGLNAGATIRLHKSVQDDKILNVLSSGSRFRVESEKNGPIVYDYSVADIATAPRLIIAFQIKPSPNYLSSEWREARIITTD